MQISTLITNCYQSNDINKIAKINNMFNSFFDKNFVIKLINLIINKKEVTDNQLIELILKYKENKENKENILKKYICSNWIYIVQYVGLLYRKLINNTINGNYVDIGCGDGNKTNKFGYEFRLNRKNIYGADIISWGYLLVDKK